MAFIRKVKTASGATAVQVAHKSHGRVTRIQHIGSAHDESELQVLMALARQELCRFQLSLFAQEDSPVSSLEMTLRKSFSGLLLELLKAEYQALGFSDLGDEDFALLCIARIVEPTSKLDSLRVLSDLGVDGISKDRLYRALRRTTANDYRATISERCVARAVREGLTLVLYDVTTLYFEVGQDDEYRKPGLSKERRLEPQIIVGLLVDQRGFPLQVHSFEGNKAETSTLTPVLQAFRQRHDLGPITVVADAAMLSARNLELLTQAGYRYIVGSRLSKIPYDIAEYQKTAPLADNQIITTQCGPFRVVYQYRQKRAALDLRNIDKQIDKARKIVDGSVPAKRAKFLTLKATHKEINLPLIEKARALAGVKGYVTNLDAPDEQVIAFYHDLFHVEASFRMAKSDLRARPIFHQKRESIEAHLTIVFAAIAISRSIERRTGVSIKQFVKTLRPVRSGIVCVQAKEYVIQPDISNEAHRLIDRLATPGH